MGTDEGDLVDLIADMGQLFLEDIHCHQLRVSPGKR